MTITAEVISDSISPERIRLTTLQLRYPRFVHSELMTHRAFSRNASSSRAVPVTRMLEDVQRVPALPVYWGKNQSGMQAREALSGEEKEYAIRVWELAMHDAIGRARSLHGLGVHKQIVNRLLEPFAHINVLVTATDYANFYALRRHADAQPEIYALAEAMHAAQAASTPTELQPGEWHMPYVKEITPEGADDDLTISLALKLSVARCARLSYLTHEGKKPCVGEDLRLYQRLMGSVPLHASPAEHQATPDWLDDRRWRYPSQHGNFRGWRQYRKTLPHEFTPG